MAFNKHRNIFLNFLSLAHAQLVNVEPSEKQYRDSCGIGRPIVNQKIIILQSLRFVSEIDIVF